MSLIWLPCVINRRWTPCGYSRTTTVMVAQKKFSRKYPPYFGKRSFWWVTACSINIYLHVALSPGYWTTPKIILYRSRHTHLNTYSWMTFNNASNQGRCLEYQPSCGNSMWIPSTTFIDNCTSLLSWTYHYWWIRQARVISIYLNHGVPSSSFDRGAWWVDGEACAWRF